MKNKVVRSKIALVVSCLLMGSVVLLSSGIGISATFGTGNRSIVFYNIGSLKYDPGTAWNVTQFVKMNPEFKVEVAEVPWTQYKNKFTPAMISGATDMGEMWYPWLNDFIDKGILEPIDEIVPDKKFSQITETVQDLMRASDGHIYALPHYMNADGFYYNKEMLKEAGLGGGPKDWGELLDYAKMLTRDINGDGEINQWGFVFPFKRPADLLLRYLDFLGSAGGELFDRTGTPQINSDENLRTLRYLVDLRNKYHVIPDAITTFEPNDASRMFYTKKAAMMLNYASEMPRVLNPEVSDVVEDTVLTTLPIGPAGKNTNIATVIWLTVSAMGKNKENAKLLIDYITNWKGQQDEMIHEPGNLVAFPEVMKSERVQKAIPFSGTLSKLIENGKVWVFPYQSKVEEILEAEIELAMLREKSPIQALNDAQSKVVAIVKKK